MRVTIDSLTKSWIRNEADAKAAANGYRFDIDRAAWPIWFIGRYCRLYEGSHAGEPLVLRGAHSMPLEASQDTWNGGGRDATVKMLNEYSKRFAAGEPVDWQLDVVARLFGWVKFSERWKEETRRFNKGAVFIGKKNKKSPTLAAIAVYLMCGDGEPGMKVFLCAKNLDQAKDIAGTHALNMISSSEELQRECEISVTKARINHMPTRSMLQPLSSGDTRSQKSKEGLNGSALIDEVHVVDTEFMARIVRMGASRKEPLILSFSTAGSDLESFGYSEWLYGTENNRTGEDERYFFQSYEAPQGISDSDLAENLEKYIRMANPAMGHTIDMDEVKQDYLSSRVSHEKLAEFKQYRLNIWSRTATPWIGMDDWNACQRPKKLPKDGEVCWGAIDLGYVDEPCVFTLVFPNDHLIIDEAVSSKKPLLELLGALDQPVYARTWYWMPRAAVERWKHIIPYEQWENAGLMKVHSGNSINLNRIVSDISSIMSKYDVQGVAYDPWQTSPIMTNLEREDGYPNERFWEFPQNSPKLWAFPCAMLERLVLSGKLKRKKNAILDWEMEHATIKTDKLGGVSLVKPQRGDKNNVNGIASLIMALDAMARSPRFYRSQLMVMGAG